MFLLFDPAPPYIHWHLAGKKGRFVDGRCRLDGNWSEQVAGEIGNPGKVEAAAYLLHHGGSVITKTLMPLTPRTLGKIEDCIPFLPDFNEATFRAAEAWRRRMPRIPHFLFCSTAFFSRLPDVAGTYAVPEVLRRKNVRRFGGYGLFHEWGWKQVSRLSHGQYRRVIGVHLGNRTNMAAILNGRAIDTTIGFTPVEGIPSSTSCGDIDATVVFELYSRGMSFAEINQLLSQKSGFSGLLGRECSFEDLLAPDLDSDRKAVYDVLVYDIMKYLGAFISLLGGVDAILFFNRDLEKADRLIGEIFRSLDFLGVKRRTCPTVRKGVWELSARESRVKVFGFESDSWSIMADEIKSLVKER